MNTNRERVRIGVRLYSRRGFPRQRLCKAGLARLVQLVSGSLNNACDIRAGQTKCTLARTFYLCVCICVYIYLYKRAYVQTCICIYAFCRVRRWNRTVIRMIYMRWTVGFETPSVRPLESYFEKLRGVGSASSSISGHEKEILCVKAALTAILTAFCCTTTIFSSATAVLRSATRSAR